MDKNLQTPNENIETKSKATKFWMHVGFIAIALVLAVVTVFVLNLNL